MRTSTELTQFESRREEVLNRPILESLETKRKWLVGRGGIEPPTPGFSVPCSTY